MSLGGTSGLSADPYQPIIQAMLPLEKRGPPFGVERIGWERKDRLHRWQAREALDTANEVERVWTESLNKVVEFGHLPGGFREDADATDPDPDAELERAWSWNSFAAAADRWLKEMKSGEDSYRSCVERAELRGLLEKRRWASLRFDNEDQAAQFGVMLAAKLFVGQLLAIGRWC